MIVRLHPEVTMISWRLWNRDVKRALDYYKREAV